jgi:hypothetical protein
VHWKEENVTKEERQSKEERKARGKGRVGEKA